MSAATYTSDIDVCQRVIPSETFYEPNGTYYTQIYSNSLLEQPEGLYNFFKLFRIEQYLPISFRVTTAVCFF